MAAINDQDFHCLINSENKLTLTLLGRNNYFNSELTFTLRGSSKLKTLKKYVVFLEN